MACIMFGFVETNALTKLNSPMLRLQWQCSRTRISLTLVINFAYTVAVITMFPNPIHILYMYWRTVMIAFAVFSDSSLAYNKFRRRPDVFMRKYGGSGKRGWASSVYVLFGSLFLIADIFRHYLVLFVTKDVSLFSIKTTNPFNGNEMAITNKQIADSSYFTAMIFLSQALISFMRSSKLRLNSQTHFFLKGNSGIRGRTARGSDFRK